MTVPLSPIFDPTDNPYMPRNQQNVHLALDPNDLAFPRSIPAFPPAAQAPAVGPMNEWEMAYDDDDDDVPIDSPIILDELQDHDFPAYFRQMGSPPRLFHSHGMVVVMFFRLTAMKLRCVTTPPRAQTQLLDALPVSLRDRKLKISCSE